MSEDYHNYSAGSFGHCKCADKKIEELRSTEHTLRQVIDELSKQVTALEEEKSDREFMEDWAETEASQDKNPAS